MSRAPRPAGFSPSGRPASRRARQSAGASSPGAEDLHPVLAGVSGARHGAGHAGEDGVAEVEGRELPERLPVAAELRQHLERARPLQRDERRLVALVLELAVVLGRTREVRAHLLPVRRVADDEPVVLGAAIDDEIVEDPAALVARAGVHGLSVGELSRVVGDQIVDDVRGVLAVQPELAHVADVEHPRGGPYRPVLVDDPGVLDGQLPAGEGHQATAESDVLGMERRVAKETLDHGARG